MRVRALTPNNVYDPLEWELWLEAHSFDIEDVFRIEFLEDGRATIYQYRRDANGSAYTLADGETVATMDPVTITPKSPTPVWS